MLRPRTLPTKDRSTEVDDGRATRSGLRHSADPLPEGHARRPTRYNTSMALDSRPDVCAGCGLRIAGGTDACQALFEELSARDFSDIRYGRVHRMAVDAYALQHPDRYCISAKSLAGHLAGLCWSFEFGGAEPVDRAFRAWLSTNPPLVKPALPTTRGALTIADVRGAPNPVAFAQAVDRWARSAWDAYADLQPMARAWLERVVER